MGTQAEEPVGFRKWKLCEEAFLLPCPSAHWLWLELRRRPCVADIMGLSQSAVAMDYRPSFSSCSQHGLALVITETAGQS